MDELKMVSEKFGGCLLFAAGWLWWRWRWCFQGLRYLSGVHAIAFARVGMDKPTLAGACWAA
jgi:hypothetical protein